MCGGKSGSGSGSSGGGGGGGAMDTLTEIEGKIQEDTYSVVSQSHQCY